MLPMTTLLWLLLWPLPPPLGLASSSSSSPHGLDPRGALTLEDEEAPLELALLPLEEEEAGQEGAGALLVGPPQVLPPPPAPPVLLLLPPPRAPRSSSPALPPLSAAGGRRCVRVHESCVGRRLPCCDPCAACYCRLFNSNCFCRRFGARAGADGNGGGASFPCGRN